MGAATCVPTGTVLHPRMAKRTSKSNRRIVISVCTRTAAIAWGLPEVAGDVSACVEKAAAVHAAYMPLFFETTHGCEKST